MNQPSTHRILDPWRALEALSLYRGAVCVALLTLAASNYRPPYFDGPQATLIDVTLYIYLFIAALLMVATRGRVLGLNWMAVTHITMDELFVLILVFGTGGIGSGLAAMMVTPVAAGSLLLTGPLINAPAAIATLAMLCIEIYLDLLHPNFSGNYTQSGILGAGLFIISITGGSLARRARESEAQVQRAQSDLAKLATLSETVIQKMQAGVLVINKLDQIELLNRAARVLLGSGAAPGRHLSACAPTLWQRMSHWRDDPSGITNTAIELGKERSAWAQFTRLGAGKQASTLVVLDDASRVAGQAQSMKLASLGRLTASIAHEIRNPLSAIQNAAELAAESEAINAVDGPLINIIQRQSRRLEDIVSNVLKLSRKQDQLADYVELNKLLDQCLGELAGDISAPMPKISVHVDPPTLAIAIHPAQFSQILHNLINNAQRHASIPQQDLEVSIDARISSDGNKALIDIHDNGPGIPADIATQVFEPFFSTRHEGTGLGLFITRELCLAVGGDLQLMNDNQGKRGAFFRIAFPATLMGLAA